MRHMRILAGLAVAAAVAVGGLSVAVAQSAPVEFISARQDGFKRIGKDMEAIKKGLDAGGDLTALAANAQDISAWGQKIATMFPPGSDTGAKTAALPAIWAEKAKFDAGATALSAEADKLAAALKGNDAAAAGAAFQATGAACGACHRSYRQRQS